MRSPNATNSSGALRSPNATDSRRGAIVGACEGRRERPALLGARCTPAFPVEGRGARLRYARSMRLHHLALRTGDVDALSAFYEGVLGLPRARDARPRSVWLALDGPAVLMIEARGEGERAYPERSSELVAFAVTGAEKAAIRAKALALGCFDGETEHTVYLRDPEGRRIGVSTFPLGDPLLLTLR